MNTSRRSFLKIAGFTAAGLAVASILPPEQINAEELEQFNPNRRKWWFFGDKKYTLYGDGYHDDTEALQALIDGKKVYRQDGFMYSGPHLNGGVYLVSGTLTIPELKGLYIHGTEMEINPNRNFKGKALVDVKGGGLFSAQSVIVRDKWNKASSFFHYSDAESKGFRLS